MIHHAPSPLLIPRALRGRSPPSLSYRLLISVCAAFAFFLPFVLSYFSLADLDLCVVDRHPTRPLHPSTLSPLSILDPLYNDTAADPHLDPAFASLEAASDTLSDLLTETVPSTSVQPTTIMLACLIACCLIKSFLPSTSHPHLSSMRFLDLLKVLLAYMWYLAAYFLCNALKGFMGDNTCNVHANSISGHYLFHLYSGLALLHLHAQQTHATHHSIVSSAFYQRLFASNISKLFMFVWVCYSLISAIILMNTYLHGYHSLRQILYGVCMALVSHWLMMEVLEMLDEMLIHHFDVNAIEAYHTRTSHLAPSLSSSTLMRKRTLHPLSNYSPPVLGRTNSANAPVVSPSTPVSVSTSLLDAAPTAGQLTSALTAPHAPLAPRYVSGFSPLQRLLWYVVQHTVKVSEERGMFFVFPFALTFILQVVGFVLLLLSPSNDMWRALDLVVVGASWVLLGYLFAFHLKLPVAVKRESPRLSAEKVTSTPS